MNFFFNWLQNCQNLFRFPIYLSGTVRARQPVGEGPKIQYGYFSLLAVATTCGSALEIKSLVKTSFVCLKTKKIGS